MIALPLGEDLLCIFFLQQLVGDRLKEVALNCFVAAFNINLHRFDDDDFCCYYYRGLNQNYLNLMPIFRNSIYLSESLEGFDSGYCLLDDYFFLLELDQLLVLIFSQLFRSLVSVGVINLLQQVFFEAHQFIKFFVKS